MEILTKGAAEPVIITTEVQGAGDKTGFLSSILLMSLPLRLISKCNLLSDHIFERFEIGNEWKLINHFYAT